MAESSSSTIPSALQFKVECGLVKIDELSHSIDFDFVLYFLWEKQPEAGGAAGAEASSTDFVKRKQPFDWMPEASFFNLQSKTVMEESFFESATHCAALLNWILTVKETLELERFPYDRQLIKVTFEVPAVRLVPYASDAPAPSTFPSSQMSFITDVPNWLVDDCSLTMNGEDSSTETEIYLEARLTREPWYYLWNIVVIIFVLILAAFCVVAVPADELADRMSITMTLMLTIVAFKFVIGSCTSRRVPIDNQSSSRAACFLLPSHSSRARALSLSLSLTLTPSQMHHLIVILFLFLFTLSSNDRRAAHPVPDVAGSLRARRVRPHWHHRHRELRRVPVRAVLAHDAPRGSNLHLLPRAGMGALSPVRGGGHQAASLLPHLGTGLRQRRGIHGKGREGP